MQHTFKWHHINGLHSEINQLCMKRKVQCKGDKKQERMCPDITWKMFIWGCNRNRTLQVQWYQLSFHQLCLTCYCYFAIWNFFEVKLTFEMLTVRPICNSIHVRHTNGCSCESVKVFETENVSTWEGHKPPICEFMPNAITIWNIRTRYLLSHVLEYWRYRYFLSKVNIWNVDCARATAFIFDTWTGVLVKVSKFLKQKISLPKGDSNPQPSDSCRMF